MMYLAKYRAISAFMKRGFCSQHVNCAKESFDVIYKEQGDPVKVLQGRKTELSQPGKDDVFIRMIASPINPADINMIQGVYPIKPSLPAVGGNEGVGQIIEIGNDVTGLKPGDWVLPIGSGMGTWRTHFICKYTDVLKVDNNIPIVSAATLAVNPSTAYRMLKDFENLSTGDIIIQNGSNSGVGQSVIEIAAAFGLETVNIIRDRPNIEEVVTLLKGKGATHVVTDKFVKSKDMKDFMKTLPQPKLALNCVGGKDTSEMLKYLCTKGTMVTYGAMSKMPMLVPAGPLIFKDVRLRGYWMTEWSKQHKNSPLREEMIAHLCEMIRDGSLTVPPMRRTYIEHYEGAIKRAMEPYTTEKQLLVMDPPTETK